MEPTRLVHRKWFASWQLLLFLCILSKILVAGAAAREPVTTPGMLHGGMHRPVTMADAIGMTIPGDPNYYAGGMSKNRLANFSPDGKEFIILVRKGHLENNTNEYCVLLWKTGKPLDGHTPTKVLCMSSSSNRAAIEDITWLEDNETLVFLGEHPKELRQLYSFNIRTHVLKRLANHATSLLAYSVTPTANQVAYTAEAPIRSFVEDRNADREGLAVSNQNLFDLLTGRNETEEAQLFYKRGNLPARRLRPTGRIPANASPLLSPNGRYIVLATHPADIPQYWRDYTAAAVRLGLTVKLPAGQYSPLLVYRLVDTLNRESRTLLDSPVDYFARTGWAPNSASIILSGVFLPFEDAQGEERQLRRSRSFSVEVNIPRGGFEKISNENLRILKWDSMTHSALFETGALGSYEYYSKIWMRHSRHRWERIDGGRESREALEISLEEDMNTPPAVYGADSATHKKTLLFDLNPQLKDLTFGRAEEITWKSKDGREMKGGLFFPVGYTPGKRYPLIIQTHAWWGRNHFHIDGPWAANFGVQPLVGKGFMVLQTGEETQAEEGTDDLESVARYWNTPIEVLRAIGVYEGAIDYLDSKGMIDRDRVGLVGFSRTCWYVKYALTHSKYHFAAVSVMDGFDAGYFQYISGFNSPGTRWSEEINGGIPFGKGLESWSERSPIFGADKVQAPVLIIAPQKRALLLEWEWFAALSRLNKPVELVYMQDGLHQLEKPWERLRAAQSSVDWFVFWLEGQEDPDPVKAKQYARWRELRKLQSEDNKKATSDSPPLSH